MYNLYKHFNIILAITYFQQHVFDLIFPRIQSLTILIIISVTVAHFFNTGGKRYKISI